MYKPLLEKEEITKKMIAPNFGGTKKNRVIRAVVHGLLLGFFVNSLVEYYKVTDTEQFSLKGLMPSKINGVNTRVLCIVMTDEKTFKERGFNITDTWGKRCNKILFFSETTGTRNIFYRNFDSLNGS